MVGCASEGRAHSFLKLYICARFPLRKLAFSPIISGIKASVHFSVDGILCRAHVSRGLARVVFGVCRWPVAGPWSCYFAPLCSLLNMDPYAAAVRPGRATDRAGMLKNK